MLWEDPLGSVASGCQEVMEGLALVFLYIQRYLWFTSKHTIVQYGSIESIHYNWTIISLLLLGKTQITYGYALW